VDRMLGLLLVSAVVVLWVVAGRYLHDGRWRVGPAALAVAVLLFAAHEVWWWRHESRYAEVTAAIHGGDGQFACERITRGFFSSRGFVGHVELDATGAPLGPAFLAWDTCSGLRRWSADGDPADLGAIMAAHALVHEAAHLAGVVDEGAAECLALTHDQAVWMRLGATEEAARAAFDRYLTEVRPRMPTAYVTECPASKAA